MPESNLYGEKLIEFRFEELRRVGPPECNNSLEHF